MTYEQYIKQPMQAVELKKNGNFDENPHLISSHNRYINHPLLRRNSRIPFNNQ